MTQPLWKNDTGPSWFIVITLAVIIGLLIGILGVATGAHKSKGGGRSFGGEIIIMPPQYPPVR